MEEKDIKTIKTTKGELRYYRNGDYDGVVCMLNAQTIGRYKEIKNQHPEIDDYGVWWAFSNEQFARGRQHAIKIGKLNPMIKSVMAELASMEPARRLSLSTRPTISGMNSSRKNATRRRSISTNTTITSA
ncbi:hypothetical protein [Alistipes putredinis]|uniref:hypothetical protein n=1 Tax=Alistipes putredinis TaxID=28117 RepID=UPI003AB0E09E